MKINPLTKRPSTPIKFTTRAFNMTQFNSNTLASHRSEENNTDQFTITDCDHLTHNNVKSRIDYLTIQLKPTTDLEFQLSSEVLISWLNKIGIGVTSSEPELKYFDQGCLLRSIDLAHTYCGAIKWNDTHDLIQLELSGQGCHYANTHNTYFFIFNEFAKSMQVKVKRLDIAVDTFEKKHGLRYVQQAYSRGLYSPATGSTPKRKDHSSDTGKSIIIGSRHSHKHVICYEKGKQLKFPVSSMEYERWFRHELRLIARASQPIPFDALFNPDEYFLGAFPKAHRRLIKNVEPRCIKREVIKATDKVLTDKLAYAKHQVGKTIYGAVERGLDSEIIVKTIMRKGKKDNICYPSFITEEDLNSYIFK